MTDGASACITDLKPREWGEDFGKVDKAEEFFKVSCDDILVNNAWINTCFGWRNCMAVNIMAVMMGTVICHGENEELSLDWEKRWLNESRVFLTSLFRTITSFP